MASIIVAQAKNRVIGMGNDLPWHLPADLAHFRLITTGKTVVMGKKTYESIYKRLNGPLPNRRNIVLKHDDNVKISEGFEFCSSLEKLYETVDINSEDVFFIGGGQVYKSVLENNLVTKIYLTQINLLLDGDTFFPVLSPDIWHEINLEKHSIDEKNKFDYDFIILEKIAG